jgi:hypothetical protein
VSFPVAHGLLGSSVIAAARPAFSPREHGRVLLLGAALLLPVFTLVLYLRRRAAPVTKA